MGKGAPNLGPQKCPNDKSLLRLLGKCGSQAWVPLLLSGWGKFSNCVGTAELSDTKKLTFSKGLFQVFACRSPFTVNSAVWCVVASPVL